jgi:hypothetical protein
LSDSLPDLLSYQRLVQKLIEAFNSAKIYVETKELLDQLMKDLKDLIGPMYYSDLLDKRT